MMAFSNARFLLLVIVIACSCFFKSAFSASFDQDFVVTWGDGRGKILNNGLLLDLSLDKTSGSGIKSRNEYLYARIDMSIKLVPGNSAGTVTTYYLSSQGTSHDEIDFEFLGNLTGSPYTLHTNVYTQGYGGREQQFTLWFDPTTAYHTYSMIWNPHSIYFFVDDIPIREFKNLETYGVPYPSSQPMSVYACLWDAEEWATQGGRVKTDWTQAPFTASFTGYHAEGCTSNGVDPSSSCNSKSWYSRHLHEGQQYQLKWVQDNYMIYNYCTDTKRFPRGIPFECTVNV